MKKEIVKYSALLLFFQSIVLISTALENIPFTEYLYRNKDCFSIKHTSGSLIFIPENAFVPAVSGAITIKYRELHSKVDMLQAGIEMFCEVNGKRRMLESAGMFEIYAESAGKQLELAPGKTIQVRMQCKQNLPDLESFVYDKAKKSWDKTGTPVMNFSYKKNSNSKDNPAVWGSTSRNSPPVIMKDSIGEPIWDSVGNMGLVGGILDGSYDPLPDAIINGMNIKKMGLYNYDRLYHDEKAIPIFASFKLSSGEVVKEAFVAYKDINSLIHYYEDDFKERFVLLPVKGISIFCILKDSSIAIMDQKMLDELDIPSLKGKEYEFILVKQPAKPKSSNELAKAARID